MNQTPKPCPVDFGVLHSCILKFGKNTFTITNWTNSGVKGTQVGTKSYESTLRNKHSHLYDMTWLKMCWGDMEFPQGMTCTSLSIIRVVAGLNGAENTGLQQAGGTLNSC